MSITLWQELSKGFSNSIPLDPQDSPKAIDGISSISQMRMRRLREDKFP